MNQQATLANLLERTSRTFGLAIPLLPPTLERQVTIAYLLFRIVDTIEDAVTWPPELKLALLSQVAQVLDGRQSAVALSWPDQCDCMRDDDFRLLQHTHVVSAALAELPAQARVIICRHLLCTIAGMRRFLADVGESGQLRVTSWADLRRYCYCVAGVVGEMLTELFLVAEPRLGEVAERLRAGAASFGEGLQLVNILKDDREDASQGRFFLHHAITRAEAFGQAREDLTTARKYVHDLQAAAAPDGIIQFAALPLHLADASLDRIEENGPGSKLTRDEVLGILAGVSG